MAAPMSASSPVARWYRTTYIISRVAPITVSRDAASVARVASEDLGRMAAPRTKAPYSTAAFARIAKGAFCARKKSGAPHPRAAQEPGIERSAGAFSPAAFVSSFVAPDSTCAGPNTAGCIDGASCRFREPREFGMVVSKKIKCRAQRDQNNEVPGARSYNLYQNCPSGQFVPRQFIC